MQWYSSFLCHRYDFATVGAHIRIGEDDTQKGTKVFKIYKLKCDTKPELWVFKMHCNFHIAVKDIVRT